MSARDVPSPLPYDVVTHEYAPTLELANAANAELVKRIEELTRQRDTESLSDDQLDRAVAAWFGISGAGLSDELRDEYRRRMRNAITSALEAS